MSIKFSVYKTPRPNGSKEKLEHARLVSRGTKGLAEICRDLSDTCTVTSADIKGVLEALTVYMGRELGYGYSIDLEGIGQFSPALRTRKVSEEKGRTKYMVSVDGVNFRCANRLKELVKEERPKKVKRENISIDTIEVRKNKMLEHIRKHESINETDYAELNNCTRYRAGKDLKQFQEEGIIRKMGYKTHRVYVLSSEMPASE